MPENRSNTRIGRFPIFVAILVACGVIVVCLITTLARQIGSALPTETPLPTGTSALVVGQTPTPAAGGATSIPADTPIPPTPVVSDPRILVQNELNTLTQGLLAFNPPTTMTVGEVARVEVRIQSGPLSVTTTRVLTEGLPGTGIATVEPISTYTFMKARLIGDSFDITPLTEAEQIVSGDGYTQWSWDVLPKEAGSRTLNLIVSVRIKIPGYADETKDFPVKAKAINVQVNFPYSAGQFIAGNWPLLAAIILLPLAVLVYRQVSGRAQKIGTGTETPSAQIASRLAPLHRNLYTYFTMEELETLCLELGVNANFIKGDEIVSKSRELILYLERRGEINKLVEVCKALRPNVSWD